MHIYGIRCLISAFLSAFSSQITLMCVSTVNFAVWCKVYSLIPCPCISIHNNCFSTLRNCLHNWCICTGSSADIQTRRCDISFGILQIFLVNVASELLLVVILIFYLIPVVSRLAEVLYNCFLRKFQDSCSIGTGTSS